MKEYPLLLVYSSGTSGQPPQPILYTNKDMETLRQGMLRFDQIAKPSGVFYNLIPFAPHMAFYFCCYIGEIAKCLMINTGGGKHVSTEQTVNMMKQFPPESIAGMSRYVLKVLAEAKHAHVDLSKLKCVWGANGVPDRFFEDVKSYQPTARVYATYGFTEARCAWTTSEDPKQGFIIFQESGRFENSPNGELIFYNRHYPKGFHTKDLGKVKDGLYKGEKVQFISFDIKRIDGKVKEYVF